MSNEEKIKAILTVVVGIIMLSFILDFGLNTSVDGKAQNTAQIDVLIKTEGSTARSKAFSTLEEAEKFANCVSSRMDVTKWGYGYAKCNVTFTANYQNIISVKQPNAAFLTDTFGWHMVEINDLEFVEEPSKIINIEPCINTTKHNPMLLTITLEDKTVWYICIYNTST